MNCNTIREELVEVASGSPATPEIAAHLRSCAGCVETLEHLKQTMALMDEWAAPEPSPYFDTRLQARLREEQAARPRGWFEWFRRPAAAAMATVLLVAGVAFYNGGRDLKNTPDQVPQTVAQGAPRGTAVGDLQFLEKNSEVLSDFDALDALDGDEPQNLN